MTKDVRNVSKHVGFLFKHFIKKFKRNIYSLCLKTIKQNNKHFSTLNFGKGVIYQRRKCESAIMACRVYKEYNSKS